MVALPTLAYSRLGLEKGQMASFYNQECAIDPPPIDETSKLSTTASRMVFCNGDAARAWRSIKTFLLEQEVPFQIEQLDAWSLSGTAFLDFVPVGIAVKIWKVATDSSLDGASMGPSGRSKDEQRCGCRGHTVIQFDRLASCSDVVGFSEMVRKLSQAANGGRTDQDWLDMGTTFSDSTDATEETTFGELLEGMLQEALFGPERKQLEAWQSIAQLCHEENGCLPALRVALFNKHRKEILEILNANSVPVAIQFPVAALLRLAASFACSKDTLLFLSEVRGDITRPSLVTSTLSAVRSAAAAKKHYRGHLSSAETSDDGSGCRSYDLERESDSDN